MLALSLVCLAEFKHPGYIANRAIKTESLVDSRARQFAVFFSQLDYAHVIMTKYAFVQFSKF